MRVPEKKWSKLVISECLTHWLLHILSFKESCNLIGWEDEAYQNKKKKIHCTISLFLKCLTQCTMSKQFMLLPKTLLFKEFCNLTGWESGADQNINSSLSGVAFLFPLETSENRRFSNVFRGYKKRTPGSNGLKTIASFYCFLLLPNSVRKIKTIHALFLKILSLTKSCNLIGLENFRLYLKNKNFPRLGICTVNQYLIMFFISDHFLQKLLTTVFEILGIPEFLAILGTFYPNKEEYELSRKIRVCHFFKCLGSPNSMQKVKKKSKASFGK